MDERILQLRVGIFVLLAFMILLFLIWLNTEMWKGRYSVYINPTSAPGVTRNTPIRKNGILIGRVEDVRTRDDRVIVELGIDDDIQIYSNEVAAIGTESLLGDTVIEIVPLPVDTRGTPIEPGGVLERVSIRRDPMEVVDVALDMESKLTETLNTFNDAGAAVQEAGAKVSELADTFQQAMGDTDIKALVEELRATSQRSQAALDNFNRMFENVNEVVGDPDMKDRIREFIESLPEVFGELRATIEDTRTTVNSFQAVSEKATTNLDNLTTFTDSLKSEGPIALERLNRSLERADGVFEKIEQATQSLGNLQNAEGTIGKLLKDPELYNTALESAQNIRDLTIRLEPLINDVRMFADALARDGGGQLGLRGALRNRDALNTGYKGNVTGRRRTQRK